MSNTISDLVGNYVKLFADYSFVAVGAIIAVLVLAVFVIACFVANSSRMRQLKLRLQHVSAFVKQQEEISEENVALLNRELKVLPEDIRLGWGNFLDRQAGYPSEYMSEPEILKERSYQTKSRAGKTFFHLFAWIVMLLGVGVTVAVAKYGFMGGATLFAKAATFADLLIYVLSALYIPLIVYAVLSVILSAIYKKQSKKTLLAYRAFKDALDEKVSIFREEASETDEFYQEHQDEINSAIEEIVANKIGHTEIMEIVTVPRVADVEDVAEPVSAAEPIVEVAAEKTAENDADSSQLEVLKSLVKNALNDPNATEEDLEDLQHYIMQAKIAGFKKTQDQAVLSDCILKLNEYMIVVQGKPSELTNLLFVIDNAVNDAGCTKDDLSELRALIVAAKSAEKFQNKKDQKILTGCIGMLDKMFRK